MGRVESDCAWMANTGLIKKEVVLDKGVFVISLDTELAWGTFDCNGVETRSRQYVAVREIVRKLLDLFDSYQIKATWAVVGHLFLRSCSRDGPDNHNHVLQPDYSWYPAGWLRHDPFSDLETDPFFYAPDIIEAIMNAGQHHEIGCHTFTHAILGDPECSADVAGSQLAECRRLARSLNIDLVSLVFPRNSVGHLDILCELGFTGFRGPERRWYARFGIGSNTYRACHYFDRLLAFTPRCYKVLRCYACKEDGSYLFDMPSSMFYPPLDGMWRTIGLSRRVLQAKRGISRAIDEQALFHIWFHPVNLASSDRLFDGLEEVLAFVAENRARGRIECLTMSETAAHLATLPKRRL